jgi:hypothetical protein
LQARRTGFKDKPALAGVIAEPDAPVLEAWREPDWAWAIARAERH